jgi:hypothetical protein
MKVPPRTRIELADEYGINPKTLARKWSLLQRMDLLL